MNKRKGLALSFSAVVVVIAFVLVVPSAALAGASKQVVFDNTTGDCTVGLISGTPTTSSAVINTNHGSIDAQISLKGLAPFTQYQVDIVQTPSGESCVQVPGEFTLTTNRQGNGNAHVSEPILSGSTGAFIMLIDPFSFDILATPTVPVS